MQWNIHCLCYVYDSFIFLCLIYAYFAIVRRTVTFCPWSALRCLPSSLFAAELITNDKFVEISPLAGFKQDNYLPGVGWSRQCSYHIVERQLLRTEDFLSRYDICTTSELWKVFIRPGQSLIFRLFSKIL